MNNSPLWETSEKKRCGDRSGGGWDEPAQCGPFLRATCYQAEHRGLFNLHLNTFHSTPSFAFISPIIFGNGQMSSRHNVGAYHRPEEPTPDANLGCLDLFIVMARSDNSGSLQSRGVFNWICFWWQNCFAHGRILFHQTKIHPPTPPPPSLLPSLSLSNSLSLSLRDAARLFGCHGKTSGEWFSVASDFHYLFSIRPTYLSKKKQHVEREWQAERQLR